MSHTTKTPELSSSLFSQEAVHRSHEILKAVSRITATISAEHPHLFQPIQPETVAYNRAVVPTLAAPAISSAMTPTVETAQAAVAEAQNNLSAVPGGLEAQTATQSVKASPLRVVSDDQQAHIAAARQYVEQSRAAA